MLARAKNEESCDFTYNNKMTIYYAPDFKTIVQIRKNVNKLSFKRTVQVYFK